MIQKSINILKSLYFIFVKIFLPGVLMINFYTYREDRYLLNSFSENFTQSDLNHNNVVAVFCFGILAAYYVYLFKK